MELFYAPEISTGKSILDPDESRHCIKVLRNKVGDEIRITDGKGSIYTGEIIDANQGKCEFEIKKVVRNDPRHHQVHIAIAPTKSTDRLGWFVEKAIEIGIEKITFFYSQNSERTSLKVKRLHNKAVSAMKQSLQSWLPEIQGPVSFSQFIESCGDASRYIAYTDSKVEKLLKNEPPQKQGSCVMIGPEGDFTSEEIQQAIDKGYKKISLGPNRLRTETAGIVACHILNLINS